MEYYQLDNLGFVLYKCDGEKVWYFDPNRNVWTSSYMVATEIEGRLKANPPTAKRLDRTEMSKMLSGFVNRRV